MIRAVIFDVGGVLKTETGQEILSDISQAFSLPVEKIKPVYKELSDLHAKGKITEKELWLRFSQHFNKQLPLSYKSLLIEKYISCYSKNPAVLGIVQRLKKNKYKLAILSNTFPSHAEYNKQQGLFKDFDVVVLSCDAGYRKPEKEIYSAALNQLSLEPEECIFIDDKEANAEAARELGMRAIAYQNPEQLLSELKKLQIRV